MKKGLIMGPLYIFTFQDAVLYNLTAYLYKLVVRFSFKKKRKLKNKDSLI